MSKNDRNTLKKQQHKEAKQQALRRNRLTVLAIAAALAVSVLGGVLLSSVPRYAVFTEENGRCVDGNTGIAYREAPLYYEPVSYEEEAPYGKRGGAYLYPLTGQGTDKWLTEVSDGFLRVFYAETIWLPDLARFSVSSVRVYPDAALEQSTAAILKDIHEVSELMEAILHGEEADMPATSEHVYTLKLTSDTYDWLYYCLFYAETAEGNFVRDPATGRVVEVGDRIAKYLRDIEETETTVGEESVAP